MRPFICAALLLLLVGRISADAPSSSENRDSPLQKQFEDQRKSWPSKIVFTPSAERCWDDLTEQSRRESRMLRFREFCDTLVTHSHDLSSSDVVTLWHAFGVAQKPSIDKWKLASLLENQPSLLDSASLTYSVERAVDGTPERRSFAEFAFSGSRLFFDKTVEPVDGLTRRILTAYDLTDVRTAESDGDEVARWGRGGSVLGTVGPFDRVERFIDETNPLMMSGLLSSKRFPLQFGFRLSEVAVQGFVYEQAEDFGEENCLVVGNLDSQYYLSAEKGYALVGYENGTYINGKRGPFRASDPWLVQTARDFESAAGLSIPRRIQRLTNVEGKVESLRVSVTSLSINEPVPDAKFTEVFPPQTLVSDLRTRTAARKVWGIPAGKQALTRPLPGGSRWPLIIALNLAGIGLVVAAQWFKRKPAT